MNSPYAPRPTVARITNVLVLGASGMLGNAVFRVLSEDAGARVHGTVRTTQARRFFVPELASRLVVVEDLENHDQLVELFDSIRPQVVINCTAVGRPAPPDPLRSISIFSLLPQRLARLCRLGGARLIQISSDGVFSGSKGSYTEDDFPDATDLYGIAKLLGEVREPHTITLRTSIIGHELQTRSGLLEWFLSQGDRCRSFTRAIFSGFPTVVLAELIRDVIIPRPDLYGVYHVATRPISKFDLLHLISERYEKEIELVPDDTVIIDRSLVASRFAQATGYVPVEWPELIDSMHSHRFGLART
jgi:dTDP-4-dehydrorhamnose reductase